MALVMVRFQGGPLTGLRLPVDHTATEYRHVASEAGQESGEGGGTATATAVHIYRRLDWQTFKWDRREAEEL